MSHRFPFRVVSVTATFAEISEECQPICYSPICTLHHNTKKLLLHSPTDAVVVQSLHTNVILANALCAVISDRHRSSTDVAPQRHRSSTATAPQ